MTSPDDKQSDKAKRSEGAGAARLRNKIDHGGAGDKVAFPDPAAAPLGTDDEAAGLPVHIGKNRFGSDNVFKSRVHCNFSCFSPEMSGNDSRTSILINRINI